MAITPKGMISEFVGSALLAVICVLVTVMDNQQHAIAGDFGGLATFVRKVLPAAIIYVIQISGAQLNPSVTAAMTMYGHMNPYDAIVYMAPQALGAIAVMLLAVKFHPAVQARVTAPAVSVPKAILRELVHTFVLLYRLAKAPEQDTTAFAKIMLDVLAGGLSVGAWMNPACTMGLAIATGNYKYVWFTILAQMLGGIAGMGAHILGSMLMQM